MQCGSEIRGIWAGEPTKWRTTKINKRSERCSTGL